MTIGWMPAAWMSCRLRMPRRQLESRSGHLDIGENSVLQRRRGLANEDGSSLKMASFGDGSAADRSASISEKDRAACAAARALREQQAADEEEAKRQRNGEHGHCRAASAIRSLAADAEL